MKQSDVFNEYVEVFKKLPLDKKKNLVSDEFKRLWGFILKINNDIGIEEVPLYNREILDLNKENITDEDFAEAMFVYAHLLEEALGAYVEKISDIIYK